MVSGSATCCRRVGSGEAGFLLDIAGAVGIAGADTDLVSGIFCGQGVLVAVRAADFLPVTQPLVADLPHAVFISKVVAGNKGFANLHKATDGYSTGRGMIVTAWRSRYFCLGTDRFFIVSGVVFVGRLHADFMPGIVIGKGIGLARLVGNRLSVTQPLVLHVGVIHTVAVGYGRRQFATYFGFAADSDATLLVCRLGSNVKGITGRVFFVAVIVGVFDMDTNFVSSIVLGQGVGFTVSFINGLVITQPLVLHVGVIHTISVGYSRCQFITDFSLSRNGNCALLICRRLVAVIARIQTGNRTFRIFGIVMRGNRATVFQRFASQGNNTAGFIQADVFAWQIGARPFTIVTTGNRQTLLGIAFVTIVDSQPLNAAICLRGYYHTASLATSCQYRGGRRVVIGDGGFYRFCFVNSASNAIHTDTKGTVWLIAVVIQCRHFKVMAGFPFRDSDSTSFCLDVAIVCRAMLDGHSNRHIAICRLVKCQGVSGTFTFNDVAIAA